MSTRGNGTGFGTGNDGPNEPAGVLDTARLPALCCPVCYGPLAGAAETMDCAVCGRRYPCQDGIPLLLASAASSPRPRG